MAWSNRCYWYYYYLFVKIILEAHYVKRDDRKWGERRGMTCTQPDLNRDMTIYGLCLNSQGAPVKLLYYNYSNACQITPTGQNWVICVFWSATPVVNMIKLRHYGKNAFIFKTVNVIKVSCFASTQPIRAFTPKHFKSITLIRSYCFQVSKFLHRYYITLHLSLQLRHKRLQDMNILNVFGQCQITQPKL